MEDKGRKEGNAVNSDKTIDEKLNEFLIRKLKTISRDCPKADMPGDIERKLNALYDKLREAKRQQRDIDKKCRKGNINPEDISTKDCAPKHIELIDDVVEKYGNEFKKLFDEYHQCPEDHLGMPADVDAKLIALNKKIRCDMEKIRHVEKTCKNEKKVIIARSMTSSF